MQKNHMSKDRGPQIAKLVLSLILLTLVGCQSTTLKNSWRDPDYKGPPLKKIMVVGISKQAVNRRIFEDQFVAQLKAAGVEGVQSYLFIPQDGKADEGTVKEAVQKAGADGVLVTRLVRVDVNTQVTPAYPVGMGFYGGYAGAWGGYYDPAMVTTTDTLVVETNLYGLNDSVLLWSATTQTFAPTDLKTDIDAFAKVIIEQLKKQKLI